MLSSVRIDAATFLARHAEGSPRIIDALAQQCDPLEHFGYPTSCSEGAFGCTTMVNTLSAAVGQRVLACLRAKHGTAICTPGVVRDCVLAAIRPVRPRADVASVCASIARTCEGASKTLPELDCGRFVSSMRKCHGFERAVSCLPDKCDVGACLDEWVETWSY
jgi:hypothetical protein